MNYKNLLMFTILICSNQLLNAGFIEQATKDWFSAATFGLYNNMANLVGKINSNIRDEDGSTALIKAAMFSHASIAKLLLQDKNLNFNIQDKTGFSALMYAALNHDEDMTKLLLSVSGINVNLQDEKGLSAIHWACRFGYNNIIKLLLGIPGINLNTKNKEGDTVLIEATKKELKNTIDLLLQAAGININARNNKGKTALAIAKETKNTYISGQIQHKVQELTNRAFNAVKDNDLAALKSAISQIGNQITDSNGNTLLDIAFSLGRTEIIFYLLSTADDARELLARFPFEKITPSSEIFEYFFKLAYGETPESLKVEAAKKTDIKSKLCHVCSKPSNKLCSICKTVYYCSAACQKADWAAHKLTCKKQ